LPDESGNYLAVIIAVKAAERIMYHPDLLRRGDSLLVIVDIQTKLLNVMFEKDRLVSSCRKLIQAMKILGIPMLMTEQYPKGMGSTDPKILEVLGDIEAIEKLSFSCCGAEDFNRKMESFGKKQIVVIGIEAHVCVLQTVQHLLNRGYFAYVPYDAVSSRKEADYKNALDRMRQAKAVIGSVESALFELLEKAGTPLFKEISRLIK
jgi:nicotinamidase-related amidase